MKYLDTSAFVKHYRAKEKGSEIINKLFVCADNNLLHAAKTEGMRILNPEEKE